MTKRAVEKVSHIKDLVPDPANRRKHNSRNIGMVADALREVGAARSIVIDEENVVLAGNGVLEAAAEVGITRVRVVEADGNELIAVRRRGLGEPQKRALAIYDNRTAELAEWDIEQLKADSDAGLSLQPFWSAEEEAAMLGRSVEFRAGLTDPDDMPAERATSVRDGDVFSLGKHRLVCGDSTQPDVVTVVMGKDRADLTFTSPPYAQQRDYTVTVNDWDALMRGVFSCLRAQDDGQVVVNLGLVHRNGEWWPYWDQWVEFMRASGWRRFGFYVWDQGSGLPGDWQGRLAPSHEFLFHFNRASVKPTKFVDKKPQNMRSRGGTGLRSKDGSMQGLGNPSAQYQARKVPDSVLRITRHMARGIETEHPAVFPVALPAFVMQCWPGIVYEPFSGAGSTIIAGEQCDMPVRAIELEPRYCQIAIDRREAFTGQKAVKVGEAVRA